VGLADPQEIVCRKPCWPRLRAGWGCRRGSNPSLRRPLSRWCRESKHACGLFRMHPKLFVAAATGPSLPPCATANRMARLPVKNCGGPRA